MGQGEKSVGGAENPTWNSRYLPPLSSDFFPSDLDFIWIYPVPFQSAQRLIESLDSLEYIGPMEMFTKLSKVRSPALSQTLPGGRARPCLLGEGAQLGHRDWVQGGRVQRV